MRRIGAVLLATLLALGAVVFLDQWPAVQSVISPANSGSALFPGGSTTFTVSAGTSTRS